VIVLDTDICIYIINRRDAHLVRRIAAAAARRDGAGISAISVAELEYGMAKSQHIERNRSALERFLTPLEILPFDDAASRHYGDIRVELERRRTPIGPNDLFIAAHARSLAATLVTRNRPEFERVPRLLVEDWVPDEP
jgi:tRNA(fMet)-specific endonuclease VapC